MSQLASPQLALANMNAASYAAWLYYAWQVKVPQAVAALDPQMNRTVEGDIIKRIPYYIRSTWGRVLTKRIVDEEGGTT